ncbi:unnamed protein product [Prunus armeniaca]
MDERADRQLDGYQAGRASVSRQGDGQQRDQLAGMSQAPASHTQSNVLGSHRGQTDNRRNEDREERHSTTRSRRTNSRRQATENPSQAQSTNMPPRQRRREGRPS